MPYRYMLLLTLSHFNIKIMVLLTSIINSFKQKYCFCLMVLMSILPFTGSYAQYRPELFFREDWKQTPPATPITQEHVSSKDLILNLYGTGAASIRKSNHDKPVDDPFYVWSGLCEGNWAVTLKKANTHVDLSKDAKIVWRTKQSGLRCLRLILKSAEGSWLVSEQCDDQSKDWRIHQFNIEDINWYALDIEKVVEGKQVQNPDLSKIEEIGFTDLMRGGGTAASSRLDWMEVYAKAIEPQNSATGK